MKKWLCVLSVYFVFLLVVQAQSPMGFVHSYGSALVQGSDQDTLYLRGINFNNFWLDDGSPDWIFDDPNDNGIPQPYAFGNLDWFTDAREVGFNVVRVTLNYRLFEDNATPFTYHPSGWSFLDQYVQWAKSLGIYLILDMHVPPGGLQNGPNAPLLWMNPSNQHRLVALWHEIAKRYANEPIIAGFDFLNEPTPVDSISAWENLAQRIADTIRTVDNNHLLIVEYAYGIIDPSNSWYPFWDLSQQMFFIADANVMYDFHYYQELTYALQCYNNPGCIPSIQYSDTNVIFPTESGNTLPFTKEWLADDLADWVEIYKAANVPVNIGEWAPWRANYEYNNNQMEGYEYICDLFGLFDQYQLNWQYYCYSEFRAPSRDPNGNEGLNIRLRNYLQSGSCDQITGVIDHQTLTKFHVYPNPVGNQLFIDIGEQNEPTDIKIVNIVGQGILKESIFQPLTEVNTESFPSGIYFVKIKTSDTEVILKFIKSKPH